MSDRINLNRAVRYGHENSGGGSWIFQDAFGGANPAMSVKNTVSTLTFIVGSSITL